MNRPAPVARSAPPLVVRFELVSLGPARAGTALDVRVRVANEGAATWRWNGSEGMRLAYHWLDPRENPIVWDGIRTAFPRPVEPGDTVEVDAEVIAPRPPGPYLLRFDLLEEHCFWVSEVGGATFDVEVQVAPRIARRRLRAIVHGGPDARTEAALAAQEEPLVTEDAEAVAHLVAGAEPAPDWSRRLLDAHADGWAAVGPALEPSGSLVERQRARRRLADWAPAGRNRHFEPPLLLPSLLAGLEPEDIDGLPAWTGGDRLFEGSAVVRLPTRSGRPRA
ncbi:MAG: hypothetical protein EXQ77_05105 [Thermoleophilia bacterium]|nr:hypothetical protein [Thermoleophilia bacterium]